MFCAFRSCSSILSKAGLQSSMGIYINVRFKSQQKVLGLQKIFQLDKSNLSQFLSIQKHVWKGIRTILPDPDKCPLVRVRDRLGLGLGWVRGCTGGICRERGGGGGGIVKDLYGRFGVTEMQGIENIAGHS